MDNKRLALLLSAKASKTGTHLRGIARELGIDETEVTKFGGNSKMNLGYTKK